MNINIMFNIFAATVIPRRENLHAINVTQLEKNAILVCYDSKYKASNSAVFFGN